MCSSKSINLKIWTDTRTHTRQFSIYCSAKGKNFHCINCSSISRLLAFSFDAAAKDGDHDDLDQDEKSKDWQESRAGSCVLARLHKLFFDHVLRDVGVRVHAALYSSVKLFELVGTLIVLIHRYEGQDHARDAHTELYAERDEEESSEAAMGPALNHNAEDEEYWESNKANVNNSDDHCRHQ